MAAQNNFNFTIKLRDNSVIELRDPRQISSCSVLENLFGMSFEPTNELAIDMFEPQHVRFFFELQIVYIENLHNFEQTEVFATGKAMGIVGLDNIRKVADFFDCQPVLDALRKITNSLIRDAGMELLVRALRHAQF